MITDYFDFRLDKQKQWKRCSKITSICHAQNIMKTKDKCIII